jgi:hypothetical protein
VWAGGKPHSGCKRPLPPPPGYRLPGVSHTPTRVTKPHCSRALAPPLPSYDLDGHWSRTCMALLLFLFLAEPAASLPRPPPGTRPAAPLIAGVDLVSSRRPGGMSNGQPESRIHQATDFRHVQPSAIPCITSSFIKNSRALLCSVKSGLGLLVPVNYGASRGGKPGESRLGRRVALLARQTEKLKRARKSSLINQGVRMAERHLLAQARNSSGAKAVSTLQII